MTEYTMQRIELFKCFLESVTNHFSFLEKLSYRCSELGDGHILYSSELVEVNIYYERISFEMYLVVTLKKLEISYTIDELLNFSGDSKIKRQYQSATNYEIVEKCVNEMASFLQTYGKSFINGDVTAFKDVQKKRDEENKNLILKTELLETEKQAISAWDCKDYLKVIELYSLVSEHLTPSQKKRLEICTKMIK